MSEREKWVGLVYKDNYFGDMFKISTNGNIMNKKSKHIYKKVNDNNTIYCIIYYENTCFRINVGKAQIESGLEVTVYMTPELKLKWFEKNQAEMLEKLYGERIDELEKRYMERMDNLEIKIYELTKQLKDYKND